MRAEGAVAIIAVLIGLPLPAVQSARVTTLARTVPPTVPCPSRRMTRRSPKPFDGLAVAYKAANNSASDNTGARADCAIDAGAVVPASAY